MRASTVLSLPLKLAFHGAGIEVPKANTIKLFPSVMNCVLKNLVCLLFSVSFTLV
jgi:hypothetical protein